jgi:hypothetical protein
MLEDLSELTICVRLFGFMRSVVVDRGELRLWLGFGRQRLLHALPD